MRTARDQILTGLSDPSTIFHVLERAYAITDWAGRINQASAAAVVDARRLVDDERVRLATHSPEKSGRFGANGSAFASARQATADRLARRQSELTRLVDDAQRLGDTGPAITELDQIVWQHPLRGRDATDIATFVDLWVTIRVDRIAVITSPDPWDAEGRARLDAIQASPVRRNFALVVEPVVRSLSDSIRRIRLIQVFAPDASPLIITEHDQDLAVFQSQHIPIEVWVAPSASSSDRPALASARPARRDRPTGPIVPTAARTQLPGPRRSLPPAGSQP